jgi:4-amino-4-deoxy-L-arabinose transferase-like glycosyltransferase
VSRRGMLWGMVAVLLVAAALRLVAFGQVPPGLYHDEAYHGLDALDILQGNLSLYFPANNGREPLFIYLIALAVGLLGRSPFALRLVACFAGLLTVAATAAMGRALFSRRVGLLAGAVLAVTLWHVHLSRVGYRAVLLPLFTALAIWQGAWGIKSGRWQHWLAAGVLYGISFYTYTAVRFTPVALGAFCLYALAIRPPISSPRLRHGVGLAVLALLATLIPLAVYTIGQPDVVLGRLEQVSVFSPAINGGDPWGTLGAHTLRTLGLFFVRGDRIWRHNVPWRPVFDPLLGAAFVLGLLISVRRLRRDPAAGFVLVWTAVMSLPTLLAEDAPHFLRAVGVLPVVALFPALGLNWLAGIVKSQISNPQSQFGHWSLVIGHLAVLAFLLFSLVSTAWAYFGDYARNSMTAYWFERGATTLAGRVNGFLGVGWDGERMMHGGPGDGRVYLDPWLWEEWPQVRFLIAAPEAVTLELEGEPCGDPTAVFVWPYEDWTRAWNLLPSPAEITVEEGPLSQGDRDPEPYTTYLAFFATPPNPATPAQARFSGGVELLGVEVAPAESTAPSLVGWAGGGIRIRLRWRAIEPLAEDYVVFLHYLRDGGLVAQADGRPAEGRYPTMLWHPGDVVNDDHYVEDVGIPIPGRDVLRFGFWQPESGAKLFLLDEAGNPAGDWLDVRVESLISPLGSRGL